MIKTGFILLVMLSNLRYDDKKGNTGMNRTLPKKILALLILITSMVTTYESNACGAGFIMDDVELNIQISFPWGLSYMRHAPKVSFQTPSANERIKGDGKSWEGFKVKNNIIYFNNKKVGAIHDDHFTLKNIKYKMKQEEDQPCPEENAIATFKVFKEQKIIMTSSEKRMGCGNFGDLGQMRDRIIGYLLWRDYLLEATNEYIKATASTPDKRDEIRISDMSSKSIITQLKASFAIAQQESEALPILEKLLRTSIGSGEISAVFHSMSQTNANTLLLLPTLIHLLPKRSSTIQSEILNIFHNLGQAAKEAQPEIVALLKSNDTSLRIQAIETLKEIDGIDNDVQDKLAIMLRLDSSSKVRLACVQFLTSIQEPRPNITKAIKLAKRDPVKTISNIAKTYTSLNNKP